MSRIYETAKDYHKDSKGIACERIREELKQCLLESDCIRKVSNFNLFFYHYQF